MAPFSSLVIGLNLSALLVAPAAFAADAVKAPPQPARKSAKVAAKPKAVAAPVEVAPEPATPEQISASERVYYGEYDCDFKQVVQVTASERHPSYVELRFAKNNYLMKPVLSSTGAIRLEDVKGQTLMIQIASKSMLMNVKTGTRLVDACVSPSQRVAIDSTKAAPATENTLLTAPRP
ncbi:MAG: hypothetical protein WCJ87_10710 [Burkholderiales bacterium]